MEITTEQTLKHRLTTALNLLHELLHGDRDIEIARTVEEIEEIIIECMDQLDTLQDWIEEIDRSISQLKQFGIRSVDE